MNVSLFQRPQARVPSGAVERRAQPRAPAFRSAAGLTVEAVEPEAAAIHRVEWAGLTQAAVEPNVFLDPDFALSAAQHFATARRPLFLLARSENRLVGLCGVERSQRSGAAALWTHPYAALGSPLLHRDCAAEALDALLGWMRERMNGAEAALIPAVALDGPVAELLRSMKVDGRPLAALDAHERAVLDRGAVPPKRAALSEVLRLGRRLADLGPVEFRLSDRLRARNDFEAFLALEAAGWKGAAGTALISHPGDAAFARAAFRQMAARDLAQVARLDLDGRPIAMGIVLRSGDAASFWKIAHDPDLAKYSPGVQLTLALTPALAGDVSLRRTDSCAVENHPMINRLWPGRMAVADLLVGLDAASDAGFRRSLRRETLRRALRARCKDLYLRLTRRKAA